MLHVRRMIVLLCFPLLLAGCFTSTRLGEPTMPPLVRAAEKGDVMAVRTLLAKGADVQARDTRGRTALMGAAESGDAVTVQALLANGAEVNTRDTKGWTALMLAAGSGDTATVQALLGLKAHVNLKTNDGWTALMQATKRGHTAIVPILLNNGAEANARDKDDQTALLLAVQGGHIAIVQALLAGGADPQIKNRDGKTALALAEFEGFSNIAHLLKQATTRSATPDKAPEPGAPAPQRAPEPSPQRQGLAPAAPPASEVKATERLVETSPQPPAPGAGAAQAVPTEPPLHATPAAVPPAINFGHYEALIIGNNAYNHLRPLKTAINDAVAVAEVLSSRYGFAVTLLTDASREEIIAALDGLRMRLTEQDNLLIYYAGHGVLDSSEERGYWLPVDARPNSRVHWISTTAITDALKAMLARHVMVIADSCYSGTLTRGIDIIDPRPASDRDTYLTRLVQKRSRTVLTSGGVEPVLDSGGGEHSVFARIFLNILEENTDTLDGQQLFNAIRRPVVVNSAQTPEYADIRYAGHEGGDFLFVRR